MRGCATVVVAGFVSALVGWSGCGSSPEPQRLFAEAEGLRLRYEKGASQQAIAKYNAALTAWKRTDRQREAATAAQRLGVTYGQLGALAASLKSYQSALTLARESGDLLLESEIRTDVGFAQALIADRRAVFDEAQGQCEVALKHAKYAANERLTATALNCLGEVAYYQQRPEQALTFYDQAARLWEQLGDQRGQAETLHYLGTVRSDMRQFDQARGYYDQARSLWTSLGDRRQLAIGLVAEARLYVRRGEHQLALSTFENALALLRPMGDAVWEASSLTGIAQVYQDMGDTSSATEYFERSLELFEAAGLLSVLVDALGSLGETYLASGDDAKALNRFERALALAEQQGIQHWKAKALRFIGVVHLFRAAPSRARDYLERSLDEQRALEDPRLEARTRADLGELQEVEGDHAGAITRFNEALAISADAGDRVAESRALIGLARASLGVNNLDRARQYAERSLKVAESLRTRVESRDLRASYMASVYEYHELYIDVLMRMHELHPRAGLAAAAFEASERARARSLLESLADARVDLQSAVDAGLLEREQALQKSFADWAERRRRASNELDPDAARRRSAAEYRDLEHRYNRLQVEIRSTSPHYAAVAQPQPLRVASIQKQVLDATSVVLEYALGADRSYVWCVSNTGLTSHEIAPRSEIEQAAQRVRERLTARLNAAGSQRERRQKIQQADAEYWPEAARLSAMLLGPVAREIAGKRILVVADGALQYLPFSALPVPAKDDHVPMFVEHEIVSLPSVSALAVLRQETRDRKLPAKAVAVLADPVFEADDPRLRMAQRVAPLTESVVAVSTALAGARAGVNHAPRDLSMMRKSELSFPRLLSTRREANAILDAAPAGMAMKAIDFQASRATTMSPQLADYRIVHFATHAVFNNEDPGLSGIVLSMFDDRGDPQDGFLRLHDVYGLNLPAELIVLSACSTALGKPVKGEGLVGIVRGFMYAGSKRVLASLWKVDDDATEELMGRLYVEMLKANRSPAAALRQAQLAMWQQERWRAPFYWAAFVLQGEWK